MFRGLLIGTNDFCFLTSALSCSLEFVVGGGGGGGGVPSDYSVSTQLQLWLFYCLGCGCCWAVTINFWQNNTNLQESNRSKNNPFFFQNHIYFAPVSKGMLSVENGCK